MIIICRTMIIWIAWIWWIRLMLLNLFHILLSTLYISILDFALLFVVSQFVQLLTNYLLKFPLLFINGLKLESNWIVPLSRPRLFLYYRINPNFICFGTIQHTLVPNDWSLKQQPNIEVLAETYACWCCPWQHTLIVKLLGKKVNRRFISTRL